MISRGEFVKLVPLSDHKHTLVTDPPIVRGKSKADERNALKSAKSKRIAKSSISITSVQASHEFDYS